MAKTGIYIDGKQAASTLGELEKQVRKLNNEIKKTAVGSEDYAKKVDELKKKNGALTEHRNQIKGVGASYGQAKQGLGSMLKQFAPMAGIVGIAGIAISGLTSAVTSWYTNNKQMEKSLSSLRSITGASIEDIKFYKQEALEMAKTSTYSAMQIVEGYQLIGSARPELLKNKEALSQVTKETLTLAEAGQIEMTTSAAAMAGMLNQFNLTAADSSRIINTLAAGSKEGAAEIQDITLSIDKFGTVAASNNVKIEESVGLTELLAEKNLKGAEAGTQLRNVLLNVATASSLPKEAQMAMEKYGVNLSIVENKALPLQERLKELSKVQGDQNALVKIFGKENVVAGQTILQNLGRLDELTKAVTGTNVAYEQAAINTDNLDGDLKRLGSAWEGLTLSMDGGASIFRPLVQAGTDMLNWTTDTINAFKNWDTNEMETSVLRLSNGILSSIPILDQLTEGLQEWIDDEIRINEMTSEVVNGMKAKADESVALTLGLARYTGQLKNSKLSEEERNRIQGRQSEIINKLKSDYPELTKNIDFHNLSAGKLAKLQKEINSNLVEQSLKAVEAAESERILAEIVEKSMKISQQRVKEQKQGFLGKAWDAAMGNSSIQMQADLNKSYKDLRELPKTMKQVKKQVELFAPEFGLAYKTNVDLVNEAAKEIDRLERRMAKASGSRRKALAAELKGQKELLKRAEKDAKEAEDVALKNKQDAEAKQKEEAEKREVAIEQANERNKQRIEEARQRYKQLRDELDNLIESTEKFKKEFDYSQKLKSFKDEQQKELFELEHTIEAKYEKEIESATKLSKEKGKLGADGQKQLNSLLAIKEEELTALRLEINKKYEEKRKADQVKAFDEDYKRRLEHQQSLEKAIYDIKVAKAQSALLAVAENDLAGQKLAQENLRSALLEQLEWETEQKRQQLLEQNEDKKISDAELLLQVEDLERQKQDKILEINKETGEKISKMETERVSKIADSIGKVIDTIAQLQDANTQIRLNDLETERQAQADAIKSNYENDLITKEEYDDQIQALDEESNAKKKKIEYDAAVRQKEIAKAQAIMGAAQATIQAFATLGPVAGAIAAALVAVTTAAQIGVIESQPLPQMYDGGFHNVIGAKDNKRYNAKFLGRHKGGMLPSSPSLLLASEKGPEYFVPNHLLRNQTVINSVRTIEAIRTNQYADGGFTSPSSGSMNDDQLLKYLEANYIMLVALNNKLPNLGVSIGDKQIGDIQERITEIEKFRS